jgi:hypothetical protein
MKNFWNLKGGIKWPIPHIVLFCLLEGHRQFQLKNSHAFSNLYYSLLLYFYTETKLKCQMLSYTRDTAFTIPPNVNKVCCTWFCLPNLHTHVVNVKEILCLKQTRIWKTLASISLCSEWASKSKAYVALSESFH